MFKLDCDPINAGFVMINRRIRSNFPLERQTSAEEETAQIHFNLRELKIRLHENRVSNEI